MAAIASEVVSALQAFNESWQESRASTGSVERPPAGEWNNRIKDAKFETEGVTFRLSDGQEVPAFSLRVTYETLDPHPPEVSKTPLEWPGKTIVLPLCGWKTLPECSKKTVARMETERLKGLLQASLGDQFTNNIAADVQRFLEKVASPEVLALRVKCQYRKGTGANAGTYFDDFGVKNLSS